MNTLNTYDQCSGSAPYGGYYSKYSSVYGYNTTKNNDKAIAFEINGSQITIVFYSCYKVTSTSDSNYLNTTGIDYLYIDQIKFVYGA